LLVKQQTMLANAVRGLAAEFGLVVPQGISRLGELMALIDADAAVPEKARQVVRGLLDQGRWLAESIETFEAEIVSRLPSFSDRTEHLAENRLCCQHLGELFDQRP